MSIFGSKTRIFPVEGWFSKKFAYSRLIQFRIFCLQQTDIQKISPGPVSGWFSNFLLVVDWFFIFARSRLIFFNLKIFPCGGRYSKNSACGALIFTYILNFSPTRGWLSKCFTCGKLELIFKIFRLWWAYFRNILPVADWFSCLPVAGLFSKHFTYSGNLAFSEWKP